MLNNLLDRNMRTIYYYICFVLGLVGFVACSEDNGEFPDVPNGELCSLTIQLGAANNQETRVGGDDNALDGEFINSLWVFITDDNGVVEKRLTLDEGSTSTVSPSTATGGNTLEWRHTIEDLRVGDKFIYAFANMEKVSPVSNESQNMSTLLSGIQEGANLSNIVDELVINDPASTVNIANEQYIPMSLKEQVSVTGDQIIRVKLVRLVGRVNIQLKNSKASDVFVTSFTMSNFANKVALMPKGNAEGVDFNQSYSTFSADAPQVITGNNGAYSFSFYVNETDNNTDNNTPFSIQLTADNKNYSATTEAKAIPRNSILPLNLTISESDLNLEVMAYIAPIGGYPVQVYTSSDLTQAAAYSVTLPEGCTFQVTGTLADNTPGTCELSYVGTTDQKNIKIIDDAVDKSWAYVTALPGLTTDETKEDITRLKVSFKVGEVVRATCTLNVSTEALKDWGEGGYPISSSLRQWQAAPAWYEVVPLRVANPE